MATLYVTESGVQVHKQGQRLQIRRSGEVIDDIPLINVERVVLVGRGVSITTPALYELTQKNIDILYMNNRGGFVSRMVGREHRHSRLRHAQALAISNLETALQIARSIVAGKVNNQRVLVQRHAEGASWAQQALLVMDSMRRDLDQSQTLDELRGKEGLAAREYFGLLRRLFRPPSDGKSWGFETRAYYPPPDPINALLSFGYTLLLQDLIAACQIVGLDPDLGFFHAIDYGRPSMALDLEEEFRPIIVDSIVMAVINRPLMSLQDFEVGAPRQSPRQSGDGNNLETGNQPAPIHPIHLKEQARKNFIALYETRMNEQIYYPPTGERTTYRRVLELQAYTMARTILGETSGYQAFLVK